MAPPVTPSPRRFIPDPRHRQQPHPPHPPSSLRHQHAANSSSQFAPTPRFNFSSTKKSTDDIEGPGTSPLAARPRPPSTFKQAGEDIEDVVDAPSPTDAAEDEMLLDTVEFDSPPHKRRKTELPPPVVPDIPARHMRREFDPIVISSSPGPDIHSSPSPSPEAPAAPQVLPRTPQHTRHRPKPAFATPAPTTASAATASRPQFILPPPEEPPIRDVLPEVFSPHRRGQRFVPGGMASTVRDWLVDLTTGGGSMDILSQRLGLRRPEDSIKVTVASLQEGRDARYTAMRSTAGETWLLLGEGGAGARAGSVLRVGDAVSLRIPIWEVELKGENYIVAVNWSAVDPG